MNNISFIIYLLFTPPLTQLSFSLYISYFSTPHFRLQVLQLYLLQQLHKGLCTSTKDFHKHKDLCPLHFTKLARSQTAPLITIILSHHHPINLCTILLNLLFSCFFLHFLVPPTIDYLIVTIINGYSF